MLTFGDRADAIIQVSMSPRIARGGRTTDRFLEFISVKIRCSHPTLVGCFAITIDEV